MENQVVQHPELNLFDTFNSVQLHVLKTDEEIELVWDTATSRTFEWRPDECPVLQVLICWFHIWSLMLHEADLAESLESHTCWGLWIHLVRDLGLFFWIFFSCNHGWIFKVVQGKYLCVTPVYLNCRIRKTTLFPRGILFGFRFKLVAMNCIWKCFFRPIQPCWLFKIYQAYISMMNPGVQQSLRTTDIAANRLQIRSVIIDSGHFYFYFCPHVWLCTERWLHVQCFSLPFADRWH